MKIKDVDSLSLKEAVDYAMTNLVKQGRMCMHNERCSYGFGGSHCVVGWLLNEKNKNLMDFSGGVTDLVNSFSYYIPKHIKENLYFFRLLQSFHDNDTMSGRVRVLKEMKLRYPHVIDLRKGYWQQWISIALKA